MLRLNGKTIYAEKLKSERLNSETITNQGYVAKCIIYNNARDVVAEFQDSYKARVHTSWEKFNSGDVSNPYHPNIYGGIIGNKYPSFLNDQRNKECYTWSNMLIRCFDEQFKTNHPTYKESMCCDEWLYYEKFYEWIHTQENFENLLKSNKKIALDKDIIIKHNRIYSPETCCLVPDNINSLFVKRDNDRGKYPIGVTRRSKDDAFVARCSIQNGKRLHLGSYSTPEQAFLAYKRCKESIIKKVAEEEYAEGNITKRCYDAMMCYEVEITD